MKARLRDKAPDLPEFWRTSEWRKRWNYELRPATLGLDPAAAGSDTIGVAVRAPDGRFGVALSTGGTAIMLRGRVGDVPIYGAGLYAGAHGAAAATGTGERIIEVLLAHTVHGWLAAGMPAPRPPSAASISIKAKAATGLIVIGPTTLGAAASRPMAWAGREDGGAWTGPTPASHTQRPRSSVQRSGSGMNSRSSPGMVPMRIAFQSALACSMRSLRAGDEVPPDVPRAVQGLAADQHHVGAGASAPQHRAHAPAEHDQLPAVGPHAGRGDGAVDHVDPALLVIARAAPAAPPRGSWISA